MADSQRESHARCRFSIAYEVPTKRLNEAVKRNPDRFPLDFMFQLTEDGVAMLSSVLRSPRAIQMNILIVRAFVRMRELLASHEELAMCVERLEAAQREHSSVISILAEEIKRNEAPAGAAQTGHRLSDRAVSGILSGAEINMPRHNAVRRGARPEGCRNRLRLELPWTKSAKPTPSGARN